MSDFKSLLGSIAASRSSKGIDKHKSSTRVDDMPLKKQRIGNECESSVAESSASIMKDEGISKDSESKQELPHFLIVGAQKGGTMAAVHNLNKHPEIFVVKEPHYFDLAWHTKSRSWYRSLFTGTSKPIVGEKTPELIYVDDCAERIKQVCPHAKFIMFIRNPIARAYSSWNMTVSKNREGASFEECVERNLANLSEHRSYGTGEFQYVQRGFYLDQIERFLKVFPDRSKLLIVVAERIRANPQQEYNKIFEFLGASPFEFQAEDEHMGVYNKPQMGDRVKERLRKTYKSHNERLFKFLGYRIDEWEEANRSSDAAVAAVNGAERSSTMMAAEEGKSPDDATVAKGLDTNSSNGYSSSSSSSRISNSGNSNSGRTVSSSGTSSGECPDGISLKDMSAPTCRGNGDFAQVGRTHGTDKVLHHGYHRFYPRYLELYRSLEGAAMLEIGIDQSHSLHTWLSYFPRAFIYGIDIDVAVSGTRHKIFKADQSRLSEVRRVVERELKHPLFFIIDDGSHIPEHQLLCFDYLFKTALQPGGTYIIEDIETSYWTRNGLYGYTTRYGYHHERSALEVFKDLLDDINREFLTERNRQAQEQRVGQDVSAETRRLVSSITFGQNCIIIVKKTAEEQQSYDDRTYRFRRNL